MHLNLTWCVRCDSMMTPWASRARSTNGEAQAALAAEATFRLACRCVCICVEGNTCHLTIGTIRAMQVVHKKCSKQYDDTQHFNIWTHISSHVTILYFLATGKKQPFRECNTAAVHVIVQGTHHLLFRRSSGVGVYCCIVVM